MIQVDVWIAGLLCVA